ncbi:hypothetical protein MNV_2310003 [Candidatus Methanoperedens nitroreducens]|uniref:Uncharacterized protein n=1 Tax=Candidatus Methanoperedens nitratireducens TaxID=1392998 RepID=A0A284VP90_9EURY|nr:hypothetical protein MNV_2310003 [Candidatus Methanoperedens nitroreducens]
MNIYINLIYTVFIKGHFALNLKDFTMDLFIFLGIKVYLHITQFQIIL